MPSKNKSEKRTRFLLPILIIFLFLLRFVSLDQSFWLDETIQAQVSQLGFKYYFFQHLPHDFNPPLFYLITILWSKIFPLNEITFRLPSIIFFGISSCLVYQISKLLNLPKKTNLAVLFLILTSPLLLYYSQEIRPYMMATATTLASTLFFLHFLNRKQTKDLLLHSLFLTLSIFTHYTTFFIFPAYFLYVFLTKRKNLKTYLTSWILPVFLFLLYSPVFLSQLKHSQIMHQTHPGWFMIIGQANLKSLYLLLTKFIIGRVSFLNKTFYLLLTLALIPLFWIPAIKKRFRNPMIYLLIVPPLLGFIISFVSPVFDYFRFLFCLPYLYLLIAKNSKKKTIFFLLALNLLFSLYYLLTPRFRREDWKGYCLWLKQNHAQTPVLVLQTVSTPLRYYCPDQNIIPITPENFDQGPENQPTILLTDYALPIFDPESKIENTLLKNYTLKETKNFNQIQAKIYKP